jgi:hypothetical protein
MADPGTILAALAAYPAGVAVLHFARWLAPLALPAIFARPAPTTTQGLAAAASDVERRLAAVERAVESAAQRHEDAIEDVRALIQAQERLAASQRHEDTAARGKLEVSQARIEGALGHLLRGSLP